MATGDDPRKRIDVGKVWNSVKINEQRIEPGVDERPGWKTVRIFVSSTFKDFHQERETLIKEVFQDLRSWCEQRKLHLIDCDLRWGVPKETTSELTLKTCLEEIDRCCENNRAPYFVNMTCKRVGWIPLEEELPKTLWDKYQLVFGLSVTEMEIVHAAYRTENPNALFLIRDDSFLDSIKDESVRNEFIDELKPTADQKLEVLKDKINCRFPDTVVTYNCEYIEGERLYTDYTGAKGRPRLKLDEKFSKTVLNFFKERIEKQYPIVLTETNAYEDAKFHHDAFMTSRSEMVFGREDILKQISDYIEKGSDNSVKLIVGEAGFGKSSVMAKAAHETVIKAKNNQLLCRGSVPSLPWTVFYHFVGAVPNSTTLAEILRRILKEMQPNEDLPETSEEIGGFVKSELLNDYQKPTVLFIDALNQIDKDQKVDPLFWLPEKLSRNVRIVLSMITDSEPHLALRRRKDLSEIRMPELPEDAAVDFVERYLRQFNKKLDPKQLTRLMRKNSAMNPLWLKIACEELRIYGDFASIDNCIKDLNGDSLSELLKQVLQRFERETDRVLLTSTLCLLRVSKSGLLETELRELLADKEHLEYNKVYSRDDDKEARVKEKGWLLPALDWAAIYRNLRVFLLPFGNPSECRLNFYHSKLDEVVQEMYFEKENTDRLWWWHKKLADFYSLYGAYDRKVEEYPYHLIQLKKYAKTEAEKQRYCRQLEDFIGKLETVKRLYEHEFSGTLLEYWRESGDVGYNRMTEHYLNSMSDIQGDLANTLDVLTERFDEMSRLLVQAGKYKEGMNLAQECLEMIQKLGNGIEKDKKLMYIYGHIAHIKSMNQDTTVQELDEIIGLHEKAIEYLKQHRLDEKDKKYKRYLGLQLIKAAYARGIKASHYDRMPLSLTHFRSKDAIKKELKERGLKDVKEAIKIYQELKDFGHELEAQLTKATLKRESKEKQLKIYSETLRRCEQLKGVNCPLFGRLCFNMGVVYGRANEHEKAYVCRKQAYIIAKKIYGVNHVKTEKYKTYLLDVAKEAKKRGQDIDAMTGEEATLWNSLIQ